MLGLQALSHGCLGSGSSCDFVSRSPLSRRRWLAFGWLTAISLTAASAPFAYAAAVSDEYETCRVLQAQVGQDDFAEQTLYLQTLEGKWRSSDTVTAASLPTKVNAIYVTAP